MEPAPDAPLRRSPLHDRHVELAARTAPFAGWEMPIDYGSVVGEHQAVRTDCGVFDLSHLGTIVVTGPGALEAVQRSFTNDAAALDVARAQYTLCLTDDGGILDDLLVYRLAWGFFVVPNAANAHLVRQRLQEQAPAGASVVDVKDDLACLAVQGPRAADVVTAAGVDVLGMDYLDCTPLATASTGPSSSEGVADDGSVPPSDGVLARSGYTGEIGFELFVPVDRAPTLWDRIIAAEAAPVGLGARDTLRLEMGYPLHGNDISPATSPVEAGLGWAVKPGTGFVGEGAYVAAKETGPRRRLRGLVATGRGIPRGGCEVRLDGRVVGFTTSGTFSPTRRTGVAMGYLDAGIELGAEVAIDVRGKDVIAEVVRPPFVHASPKAPLA